MGYAGTSLRLTGAVLTSALFQGVGAEDHSIKFKDIVPVAADGVSTIPNGGVVIQYLKSDGRTDTDNIYTWRNGKWLNSKFQDASNTVIPSGKGLWTVNNCGGSLAVNLRSSGEVNQLDIDAPLLLTGAAPVANAFPCETTFGRIVPLAADGMSTIPNGGVVIQYLESDGRTDTNNIYTWRNGKWLNSKFQDASSTVVPAGQGLWAINNCGGSLAVNLRIAAPEL